MGLGERQRKVNKGFRELALAYFPGNNRVIAEMAARASLSQDVFYAMRKGNTPERGSILKAARAAGLLYTQTNQLLIAAGYATLPDNF